MNKNLIIGVGVLALGLIAATTYRTVTVDSNNRLVTPNKNQFFTNNGISAYSLEVLAKTNQAAWQAEIGASYASLATNAINATNAQYAGLATNAILATNALQATHATNADTATYATSAGSATTATSATSATTATTATSATTASYATTAGFATNASYATNANYATTAGSVASAGAATSLSNNAVSVPIHIGPVTTFNFTNQILGTNFNRVGVPIQLGMPTWVNVLAAPSGVPGLLSTMTNGCLEYWASSSSPYEWQSTGDASTTRSTDAVVGTYSMLMTNLGNDTFCYVYLAPYGSGSPIKQYNQVTISFWYKDDGSHPGRLALLYGTSAGSPIANNLIASTTLTASSSWAYYSASYILPASSQAIRVTLYAPTGINNWVKYDDVKAIITQNPLYYSSSETNLLQPFGSNVWFNKRPIAQTDTNGYLTIDRLILSGLSSNDYGKTLSYSSNGIVSSTMATNLINYGPNGNQVVIGQNTLSTFNASDSGSVAIGRYSGGWATNVLDCVLVGWYTGSLLGSNHPTNLTTGNTAIGTWALDVLTNGTHNSVIGWDAGNITWTTTNGGGYKIGNFNTFLGARTQVYGSPTDLYIGSTALGAESSFGASHTVAINGGPQQVTTNDYRLITNKSFVLNGVKTHAQMSVLGADGLNVGATNSVGQGIVQALGYKSSDGSAGVTTNLNGFGIKNGLITAATNSASTVTGWSKLQLTAANFIVGSPAPTFSAFAGGGYAYSFDPDTASEVHFTITLPPNWVTNSTIYPKIHWSTLDTGTANVVHGLEYTWANTNTAFSVSSTTIYATNAASGVSRNHHLTTLPSMTNTNGQNSVILCRLFRYANVAADDFSAVTYLLGIDFEYQTSGFGDADH